MTNRRTEIERIQGQLRCALDGGAWHGPALQEIIGDLSWSDATRRPIPEAHSPWEIVAHIVTWLNVVAGRLGGEPVRPTQEENWPSEAEPGEEAWAELRDRLNQAHARLRQTLDGMTDDELGNQVPGQEYTNYFMVHGAVQHTLYHAGQIVVLAKGG